MNNASINIANYRDELLDKYYDKLVVNEEFTRKLVSFQANKKSTFYSWLKYKEAFSYDFVNYIINWYNNSKTNNTPVLMDPFCGTGTALTAAAQKGWHSIGIDLLPVGISAATARVLASNVNPEIFKVNMEKVKVLSIADDRHIKPRFSYPHINITKHAFPKKTEKDLGVYVDFLDTIDDTDCRYLFWFACLTILESISFTRKDGQYLRWDNRSGRKLKSKFQKGYIPDFWEAIIDKLELMSLEISNGNVKYPPNTVKLIQDSCLTELVNRTSNTIDLVITSPPYCNRYDYTRTYALELAFMGLGEKEVKSLRQELLSATVENKSKHEELSAFYCETGNADRFNKICNAFYEQKALQDILDILHRADKAGQLNNHGIPRMVEGYFFELNFVIHELARLLKPGGRIIMVNDNVRYNGEEIPVDLILSSFAESAGMKIDNIWVLKKGKGNSSQQMGKHGRVELRKCVYNWQKGGC